MQWFFGLFPPLINYGGHTYSSISFLSLLRLVSHFISFSFFFSEFSSFPSFVKASLRCKNKSTSGQNVSEGNRSHDSRDPPFFPAVEYIEQCGDRLDGQNFPQYVLLVTYVNLVTYVKLVTSALDLCVTPQLVPGFCFGNWDTAVDAVRPIRFVISARRIVCMSLFFWESPVGETRREHSSAIGRQCVLGLVHGRRRKNHFLTCLR